MMPLTAEKENPRVRPGEPRIAQTTYDVCIVGAGVAGAALAAYLGKAGKRVAVVEKDYSEQDRIVGELLQPGGVQKLHELGLESCLEGIEAAEVTGYAIFKGNKRLQIPYPVSHTGRGFRNGKFVQNLRKKMAEYGNVTRFEGTVNELCRNELGKITGVAYNDRGEGNRHELRAELTVVCDGFFSVFRKELSRNKAGVSGFFLGLILKDVPLPLPAHGHVFLTDASPFLAYPVSPTEIRMLIDFPGMMPPKKGPDLKKELKVRVLPFLPPELHVAFQEAVNEGDFKVMPNHYMPGKPFAGNGAILLGDALTMRHPLTGGGMTAAFTDVAELGRLILEHDVADPVEARRIATRFYSRKRRDNSSINILADALYRVFRDPGLAEACFAYLDRGGKYAEEPVSILSGVSRDKNLLITHFFAVARYGAANILKNGGNIGQAYSLVRSAFRIVYPLLMNEKPRTSERLVMGLGSLFFPPVK